MKWSLGRGLSIFGRRGKLALQVLLDAADGGANGVQEWPWEDADDHDQHQKRRHAGDFMPADRRDIIVGVGLICQRCADRRLVRWLAQRAEDDRSEHQE